jgi:hypothetical protein
MSLSKDFLARLEVYTRRSREDAGSRCRREKRVTIIRQTRPHRAKSTSSRTRPKQALMIRIWHSGWCSHHRAIVVTDRCGPDMSPDIIQEHASIRTDLSMVTSRSRTIASSSRLGGKMEFQVTWFLEFLLKVKWLKFNKRFITRGKILRLKVQKDIY